MEVVNKKTVLDYYSVSEQHSLQRSYRAYKTFDLALPFNIWNVKFPFWSLFVISAGLN